MPIVNFVKKARKDYPDIEVKKGEPYYWWKFNFGPKVRSKTRPRRSQLTRSDFLATVLNLEDNFTLDRENPQSTIDDFVTELENLRDECQEKFDNMPEQLQETSGSGQTLQERIDSLEEWTSELESVDTEVDEELSEEEKGERLDEIESEIKDTFGKF